MLAAHFASAQTITTGCAFAWDYDAAAQQTIDGFRLYVDAAPVLDIPADERQATCEASEITSGTHDVHVTAFNAVGESPPSNALSVTFVTTPPAAPTTFHFVIVP
ncbi:MAG: hypothetical protein R3179_08600 [Sedimenticolaceae bacterium]|nr:hypothetical protein [Sedimenticolaceae bacterium]